jgi:hypothetical protein
MICSGRHPLSLLMGTAMKRVQRHTTGSVRYDKRRKTWNYLWYDGTTRRSKRIGTKQEYQTKAAARKAIESLLKA